MFTIKRYSGSGVILCFIILTGSIFTSASPDINITFHPVPEQDLVEHIFQKDIDSKTEEIKQLNITLMTLLNMSLQPYLTKEYLEKSRIVVNIILNKTGDNSTIDWKTLSDSYYFIGVYYSIAKNYYESIKFLNRSVTIKESNNEHDIRFARALYNLGIAYYCLGDFNKHEDYSLKSLELEKKINGESSPALISTYSSLAIAYIGLQEYEKAINYSNIALTIGKNNPDSVSPVIMADMYNNLGVCFIRLADFSKAKIYLDKSESIYKNSHLDPTENYINLMNSMAITYSTLGLAEKSDAYYEKGIALAEASNSSSAFNIINSYAIILGNDGKEKKGEALLSDALIRAKAKFEEGSQSYIEVLNNYADYLREYKIDNNKSLAYYVRCMDYLSKNKQDLFLKTPVHIGYARSLAEAGEPHKALETIQSLL
ncbi:MAG: tetratricopeptide repeat protein, partial [Bacteroidia bacterium]|nr:tetratricopeptide repeat protein [Bacteroidia bacterium]